MPAAKGGNSGSFKKGQTKPGRGKSFRTKLFEVIEQEAKNELGKKLGLSRYKKTNITKELIEGAVIKKMALRAFDDGDPASAQLQKEFMARLWPLAKSVLDTITFEFPKGDDVTDEQKANAILKAISEGDIPPDVGVMILNMLNTIMEIREKSELIDRIEKLESFIESLLNKNGPTS